MNLLIEGLDGTFKTTIAQKLSDKLNYPIVKGSSFELSKGTNEDLFNYFLDLTELNNTIIDRGIFSNLTYAPLYKGYTIITEEQREVLENKLKKNTLIIYTTAPTSVIVKRLKERGDEYIKANHKEIDRISNKYTEVMSESVKKGLKVHTFDTGILSSDNIVEQIIDLLETEKQLESIVCEECNSKLQRKDAYFAGTHCITCYEKIMKELVSS